MIDASGNSQDKMHHCVDSLGSKITKSDLNLYGKSKIKGSPLWFLEKNRQAIDLYDKMYGMLLIRYL